MTSRSKNKGNKLERDMRDLLNDTYETEEFARTPGSGAIMGQSNFQRNAGLADVTKKTLGSDLICPEWFNFSVECKNYADKPNYSTIIKGRDKTLDHWLAETCFDSINFQQVPMLFFRTTRKGTHCAIPALFKQYLDLPFYLHYREFIIFGVEHIASNSDALRDNSTNPTILEWLNQSPYVTELLIFLEQEMLKTKKKGKDVVDAIQVVLEGRDGS